MTTQGQLGQIFVDNRACKNPDCACCAHWSATAYNLLQFFDTVLAAFEIAVGVKEMLLQEINGLKRRLLVYDNPNTLPSQTPISEKNRGNARNDPDNVAAKKKQGAQPGHGKTTERLPVEAEEHHRCTTCPRCHREDLTEYDEEEYVITEIPRIVKATTVSHHVPVYRCNGCGLKEIRSMAVRRAKDAGRCDGREPEPSQPERTAMEDAGSCEPEPSGGRQATVQGRPEIVHIPPSGTYGLSVLAAILFNFMNRLPHRLNVASMGRIGLRISVGTVHNILYRIGMGLDPPSREILEWIRKAYVLHIDETSISLNGKLVWIWIFLNPETGDAYYAIWRSRGGNVLREVLGSSWSGKIVCDGPDTVQEIQDTAVLGAHPQRDQAHPEKKPRLPRGPDRPGKAQGDTPDRA